MDQSSQPSISDLTHLRIISLSSLRDTLTSRSHSGDFAYARGIYLRTRVMVVSLLFLGLLPLWTLFDWFLLPAESLTLVLGARIAMIGTLVSLFLMTRQRRLPLQWSRLAAGMLLLTPALFYAWVLSILPSGPQVLVGYAFIPYMLVAMLAIFPFTLAESAVLGIALLCLEMYALHAGGALFTPEGLQAVWLLAALLVIALTANYFQLNLMLRLYREATHDPLTGLFNRGALMRAMEQVLQRPSGTPMSLLMMDLDHFKRINDQYGHAVGDDVLRHFASLLKGELRQADVIARYGGEEFVAVLIDRDPQAAIQAAERIRQQAERALVERPGLDAIRYTVSIGVATFQPGDTFQSAATRADHHLYEAKRTSRNLVVSAS